MFMSRPNPSVSMSKWVESFARDFQTERLTRFAPVERSQSAVAASRTQRASDDVCEHARTRARAAQQSPNVTTHAETPAVQAAASTRVDAPVVTNPPAPVVLDPADAPFDVPVSILRKALPGRFADLDKKRCADRTVDDFLFAAE